MSVVVTTMDPLVCGVSSNTHTLLATRLSVELSSWVLSVIPVLKVGDRVGIGAQVWSCLEVPSVARTDNESLTAPRQFGPWVFHTQMVTFLRVGLLTT